MLAYVLRRLAVTVPLLFGVTVVVFAFVHLIPGDAARSILGQHASADSLESLRKELGLTDPLPIQYGRFIGHLVQGDLGRSLVTGSPVAAELRQRFPATLELTLAAMAIAIVGGVPAGILSAVRPRSLIDHISRLVALLGVSIPIFWLGLMLIWYGALVLGWFPPSGRLSVDTTLQPITNLYTLDALLTGNLSAWLDAVWHLALPSLALSTIPLAIVARMTRSSILDTLGKDYIRTAHAKGLPVRRVVTKHALRNALIPVLTVIGLYFGSLLGGAVLTESIFSWPGVGRLAYQAVLQRDFPVIQGSILIVSVTFILINLLVDLLYAVLDPRIQYE